MENTMNPYIDTSDNNLKEVAARLNTLLADEYVLYSKTHKAHGSIRGKNFNELHKFFENQYEALRKIINDTAERVRALGHYEQGSLKEFLKVARLNEENDSSNDEHIIIQKLLEDHEAVIRSIGKDINIIADDYEDLGTALFTTGIMEHHEKMAWKLRSYLQ